MSEPIKKGDLAIIVKGFRDPSPNVGKIVTVGKIALDHPLFGPMREVTGPDLVVDANGKPDESRNRCNVPVKWLKKINPPEQKPKAIATQLTRQEVKSE